MREVTEIQPKDISRAALLLSALFLMGYTLLCPTHVAASARTALSLCAEKIVPSLALFLVGTKILLRADFVGALERSPLHLLLAPTGLSVCGVCSLAVGLLAGFPMGAVLLSAGREEGRISEREARALLPFCNAAGAGFVVGTVGAGFFGDAAFGRTLLSAQAFAAGTGVLLFVRGDASFAPQAPARQPRNRSLLPAAIAESAAALLSVCGFVLFFSVLSDGILTVFSHLGLPPVGIPSAMLRGVLELSGGLAALGRLPLPPLLRALCAGFLLGFGGISVLMQVADRAEAQVGMRGYLRGRIRMGMLCAAYTALFERFPPAPAVLLALGAFFFVGKSAKNRHFFKKGVEK